MDLQDGRSGTTEGAVTTGDEPPLLQAPLVASSSATIETAATRDFINELSRVIRTRAERALLRRREGSVERHELRQYVEDFTQEVLVILFADRARVLRGWKPACGLSLRNYVGLVAEREIGNILRSGRRRPWNEQRTEQEPTDTEVGSSPGPEPQVFAKDMLARVVARLREQTSPLTVRLFTMLFIDEHSTEDACAATGMSRDAIYAWRRRLTKIVRRIASSMSAEN